VTWQTQVGSTDTCDRDDRRYGCRSDNDGDLLFVNLSIPLGERNRVSLFSRTRAHDTTAGAQTSGNLTDNSSYSLSAERDTDDHEDSFSGSLNSNLHYTQLGLNAGTQGSDDRNYSASLNGGVALHGDGVTFSPWPIKDTFGIISAGVSGARIDTPGGPVWTDFLGRAVIPSVPAYRTTRVEMDTASLPENVDIDNGFARLAAGHGSVSRVTFHALNVRRVMMHVRMHDGTVLRKGASVVDQQGNYIATVVDDGLLFLGDATGAPALYLADEKGDHQCQIHYTLPDAPAGTGSYEQINGVCQ
jgi:outer membrane usher protein FimD/PapC